MKNGGSGKKRPARIGAGFLLAWKGADRIIHSRNSNKLLALVLLIIASLPRLFFISRDIHPNGVDEGIQIMAGRMRDAGYELYTQINTVQAPLMIAIYGAIEADPLIFRVFSTAASLIIMIMVMWVGYRIGGRHVMVAAGAFSALDLMFLHESRLASLDMFCLLWISVALMFFIKYRQSGKEWAIVLSGVAFGIGAMIKLFAVVAAGTVGIIMFLDWVNDTGFRPFARLSTVSIMPERRFHGVRFIHMVLLSGAFMAVVVFIMVRFGVMDTIQGMFLNQLHRPVLPFTKKLQYFGVFLLLNLFAIPFLFLGLRPLYRRSEGVIVAVTVVFFLFFMFQATTWIHHFVFLSPGIALTAGVGIIRFGNMLDSRRKRGRGRSASVRKKKRRTGRMVVYLQVILLILVAVTGGAFSILVKERGESAQVRAAGFIEDITEEDDFVISGDPMIPAMADRPQPPPVVNVAQLKYPDITCDQLNNTTIDYGVEVVVVTYHLAEMEGYINFVEENYVLRVRYHDNTLPFLEEANEEYSIYSLPEDSPLRNDTHWGEMTLPAGT